MTVTGTGGVGKTRLVVEAVPRLDELFDTPVRVVSLAALESGADTTILCGQFGAASPEAVAISLGESSALLVLDNCEHVADAVADFIERVLAASDVVSVLATSREPIGIPGERVVVVGPLGVPGPADDAASTPAVALFLDRAAAAGAAWPVTDDVIADVAELCRCVDGLPLAIELAATRARALSPRELLALTTRRLELLTTSLRGHPTRHQSVRAAIDVSVDRLEPTTRLVFHRLGVVAGWFDADLAHTVAGIDGSDRLATVETLTALVDRSLVAAEVSQTATRYHLLELVREYAEDALDDDERTAANERLTDAMVAEADAIVIEGVQRWSGTLVARIATQVSHLTRAIDWCVAHDSDPARAYRLLIPLFGAVHQHRSGEVRSAAARVFERWPDTPAPLRGEALAILATALAIALEPDAAEPVAAAALDDPATTGIGETIAARACVLAALSRDDLEAASTWVARGRAAARAAGLGPFDRELAGFEASLQDRVGNPDDGLATARAVVVESDVAHDPITEIWARLVIANILARAGRWDEVRTEVARARALAAASEQSWWVASIFRSQALLAAYEAIAESFVAGWDASRPQWHAAIEAAAARSDLAELALTLRAAAGTATALGHTDAAALLAAAVPVSRELVVLPELFPLPPSTSSSPPGSEVPVASTFALRAALDAVAPGVPPTGSAADPASPSLASLARDGDTWAFTFRGTTARVRDLKGIGDLAILLARPGEEVHCLEIMGRPDVGGGTGPALDEQARREYRARILELQADVDDARDAHDPVRAERAEAELDAVVAQLSEAFGLGGRARESASTVERSRNAVTFRIRTASKRIAEVHPDLGRHLTNSVRTGAWCSYQPEYDVTWAVPRA